MGFQTDFKKKSFQSSFLRISFCKGTVNSPTSVSEVVAIPFNPLFWGFLFARSWRRFPPAFRPRRNMETFNPLFWGFLFASLRKLKFTSKPWKKINLSILFFEDFFLQVGAGLVGPKSLTQAFQSSFLRISFCKEEKKIPVELEEEEEVEEAFNPLFWGFLFASFVVYLAYRLKRGLSILFFEDFFLQEL